MKHLIVILALICLVIPCMAGEDASIASLIDQGSTSYRMGNYNESIRLFDQALDYTGISANSASAALFGKAHAWYNLGEYNLAMFYSERAYRKYPSTGNEVAMLTLWQACQMATGDTLAENAIAKELQTLPVDLIFN